MVGVLGVTRLLFNGGIRLNGLTRASRRRLTGAYSPFHPAGQPFHRFSPNHTQRLITRHRQGLSGRFVSALEPSFSAHALSRALQSLRGGRSFLNATEASEAARQLTNQEKEESLFPIKFWSPMLKTRRNLCHENTFKHRAL